MRVVVIWYTATRGRGQPKPAKLKRVAKLNKQEVCGCACGGHATAMLTRDGKLYMFGSLDDDIVDKSTGGCGYMCSNMHTYMYIHIISH